jgi:DNA adenine methylase
MKPLFAWVGGKQRLVDQILPLVPSNFNAYYEPFCGSASLFLAMELNGKRVLLNDINVGIVTLYRAIYSRLSQLHVAIEMIRAEFAEAVKCGTARDYFNKKRTVYNKLKKKQQKRQHLATISVELASVFIFLIKSSYGSLYRENSDGEFNASFALNGNRRHTFLNMSLNVLAEHQNYMKKQQSLSCTCVDFSEALKTAKKNDFVFLDPPYWTQIKGGFTHYSKDDFGCDDQHHVFQVFNDLNRRGCKVMLMNSNIREVRELYKDFKQVPIFAVRTLQLKSNPTMAPIELAITNYTHLNPKP